MTHEIEDLIRYCDRALASESHPSMMLWASDVRWLAEQALSGIKANLRLQERIWHFAPLDERIEASEGQAERQYYEKFCGLEPLPAGHDPLTCDCKICFRSPERRDADWKETYSPVLTMLETEE